MDKFYGGYNSRYGSGCSKNCADNGSSRNRSDNGSYSKNRSDADNRAYARSDNGDSCPVEFHLHEVQGSVQVVGNECGGHSHRFATVSSEPITLKNGDHAHQVTFRTDSYEGHCHEFSGRTTDAFEICDGHVHYLEGKTTEQAGHCHNFKVITHIENPTED